MLFLVQNKEELWVAGDDSGNDLDHDEDHGLDHVVRHTVPERNQRLYHADAHVCTTEHKIGVSLNGSEPNLALGKELFCRHVKRVQYLKEH